MATTRKPSSTTPSKRTPSARKPAATKRSTAGKPAAARKAKATPAKLAPATARSAHTAGIAAIGALAVTALGAVAWGAWRLLRRPAEGIVPTDLLGAERPDPSDRAIDAFRPDPTAPVPASEREQFRPALVKPSMDVAQ